MARGAQRVMWFGFGWALASAAYAAPVDPAGPLDGDPAGIVNGEVEDGFPSTMSLGADFGGRMSTCTASLITPKMLLTAAHCTAEYLKYGIPEALIVEVGRVFPHADVQKGPALKMAEVINHPEYVYDPQTGTETPRFDWGVIVLEEEYNDVEPVWFETEKFDETDIGTRLKSVGYGITDARTQGGSGRRRSVDIVVADVDGQFLLSATQGNPGEGNICSGDSGGPQYFETEDGRLVQWAVHSWSDVNCEYLSGSARTDKGADFILEHVNAVHGTTDFCEITGRNGDGTCDAWCDADPDCFEGGGAAAGGEGGERDCGCDGGAGGAGALAIGAALLGLRRRR